MRLYSFTDLIQFKVAKFLRDQGLSLQKIRKSLNFLRRHLPEIERPLVQLRFLTDGETIFVLTNKDREIIDTLKKGQYVFAVAIVVIGLNVQTSPDVLLRETVLRRLWI
jgi:DNA-binding transcriptional MerR regulator